MIFFAKCFFIFLLNFVVLSIPIKKKPVFYYIYGTAQEVIEEPSKIVPKGAKKLWEKGAKWGKELFSDKESQKKNPQVATHKKKAPSQYLNRKGITPMKRENS